MAVCIGGGPSLGLDQVEYVRAERERRPGSIRVIAINNSYLIAPWADVLYFADAKWWRWHKDRAEFKEFQGVKCSIQNTGAEVVDAAVHILRNGYGAGYAAEPNTINPGQNSGYQALGIARHAGARRAVLLGYDMKYAPDGKSHWHDGHPEKTPEQWYRNAYARHFEALVGAGMEIVNASRETTLKCFPRISIEEALR